MENETPPIVNRAGDRITIGMPDKSHHVEITITPIPDGPKKHPRPPATIRLTRLQLHSVFHEIRNRFWQMDEVDALTLDTDSDKTLPPEQGSPNP